MCISHFLINNNVNVCECICTPAFTDCFHIAIQVGSAGRSEKIRTYNMRDDRVTDHRINENMYGVSRLLDGGRELDALIDMVQMEARYERLMEQLHTQEDAKTSSVADTTSS